MKTSFSTISMLSSGNETLISNYNNEEVIIDGTIKVSNTWADDTVGGVQVKKLENFTNSITQLFVGNNQMVMARWLQCHSSSDLVHLRSRQLGSWRGSQEVPMDLF